ncbi:MAG TPA: hypothetical protein VMA53_12620 [Stellaceae bacterium]|nr:hypothetical protein [Stellaceae bacterium]
MMLVDVALRLGVALALGAIIGFDESRVAVGAELISPGRNDAALEQVIGRLSLEPFVTAARWQADQAPHEG